MEKTKTVLKIVVPVILSAVILPVCIWGISRVQLKNEETKFVSGEWKETVWSENDTYNPDDNELYYTFDIENAEDFRLLVLTDIHYRNDGWLGTWSVNFQNTKTDKDIKMLKNEAKPDLIIVTGDIETGSLNDSNYESFVKIMNEIGVPWTVVFGNHDAEHRADKPAIMNIIQKSKNSVFRQGPTNLGIEKSEAFDESLHNEAIDKYAGGLGNTVINLRDKDSKIIYYAFILMDTGDWQNMYGNLSSKKRIEIGARPFSRTGVGLTNRQISWYKWAIKGITQYNLKMGADKKSSVPETMLLCHIGMKSLDYAAILSQYDNNYGGVYTKGGYDNNNLPFHTEAEWSRPSDRPYIEYDSSDEKITGNKVIMKKVSDYNACSVEKQGNDAINQYWLLADNDKREAYINGENETYPNPMHIDELVKIINDSYAIHKQNDLFLKAVYDMGSTKRIVTGHNHCDGYEVFFDGITYTSAVKTGDIYIDKECDMNNHGGSLFVISNNNLKADVESKALYTKKENYQSVRFPRPVNDWQSK